MTTDLAAILLFANSTVSIQNSIFEHNMAMVSGSIVTNGLPHLSVDNCSFHNNSGDPSIIAYLLFALYSAVCLHAVNSRSAGHAMP